MILNKFLRFHLLVTLIVVNIIITYFWNRIPESICLHYNFEGICDNYSNKLYIFLYTTIAFIFILFFDFLIKRPQYWNLPNKSESNLKKMVYFFQISQVIIVFIFIFYVFLTFKENSIFGFYSNVFISFLLYYFLPIFFLIFISWKKA